MGRLGQGASEGFSMGEVMGEWSSGRTYDEGAIRHGQTAKKSWALAVRLGPGLIGVLGSGQNGRVVDGRGDRWQGVVPGWGVCVGVPESEGSVLDWGVGVWVVQEAGAVGRGCWFRQLCS